MLGEHSKTIKYSSLNHSDISRPLLSSEHKLTTEPPLYKLNLDTFIHVGSFLSFKEISAAKRTCRFFSTIEYADEHKIDNLQRQKSLIQFNIYRGGFFPHLWGNDYRQELNFDDIQSLQEFINTVKQRRCSPVDASSCVKVVYESTAIGCGIGAAIGFSISTIAYCLGVSWVVPCFTSGMIGPPDVCDTCVTNIFLSSPSGGALTCCCSSAYNCFHSQSKLNEFEELLRILIELKKINDEKQLMEMKEEQYIDPPQQMNELKGYR